MKTRSFLKCMQLVRSDGRALLHVVNYARQRNGLYDMSVNPHGLRLRVQTLRGRPEGGRAWYELPPLGAFEAIPV